MLLQKGQCWGGFCRHSLGLGCSRDGDGDGDIQDGAVGEPDTSFPVGRKPFGEK